MASNEADEELHHFGMVVREAGLPPRPLKALVVDDDADFREMLCALLKGMGIEPIEARHGHEALWLLDEERPNIVFLDHRMPGLLGASIAKSMRATGHNVQVVLTTAEQNIDEIARAAGTMKLAKPFSVNQLRDTVLQAIGR
jgi:DNA-binding NtrC family response regulator